jgi:hypothetical protein
MSDEINNVVQEAASTIKAAVNTPSTGGGGGGGGFFGGVVSSIGNAINSAADQIGAAVTSVESAGQKVVSAVNTTVDNIARNPLPTIETAVLVSAGVDPSLASATVTYANGGSAEDAVKAGVTSAVGQKAQEIFSPSVGTSATAPDNIDIGGGFNPATGTGDPSSIPTPVEKSAVGGAARGATSAALKGGSASDIVTGGAVGALSGAGGEAASGYSGFEPGSVGSALTKNVVGSSISNIFSPQKSSQTVGGGGYTPTSVTTTGAGQAPGSQALSQALRIGDPGAPIFGGDKEDKGKQSGWNVESLRYMGQES